MKHFCKKLSNKVAIFLLFTGKIYTFHTLLRCRSYSINIFKKGGNMKNSDKTLAMIIPSVVFLFLYLMLSIFFDFLTHRNHLPIKEKIISWQQELSDDLYLDESDSLQSIIYAEPVKYLDNKEIDSTDVIKRD